MNFPSVELPELKWCPDLNVDVGGGETFQALPAVPMGGLNIVEHQTVCEEVVSPENLDEAAMFYLEKRFEKLTDGIVQMGLNRNNVKGVSPSGQKELKDEKCRAEKLSSLDEDEETGGREDDLTSVELLELKGCPDLDVDVGGGETFQALPALPMGGLNIPDSDLDAEIAAFSEMS